jgi:hypothetical protein
VPQIELAGSSEVLVRRHDATAAAQSESGSRRLSRRTLLAGGAVAGFLLLGGGAVAWSDLRPRGLPVYVRDAPENTRAAYAYAAGRADDLRYVPCFCGCGRRDGHKNVLTCFVRDFDLLKRPVYDSHGAGCPICVGVVLDIRDRLAAGKSLADARAETEQFFSAYTLYATNTPLPPDHRH